MTDVLGGRLPLSGIDVGGFGALGGLDFDLALASTFMSTAAAFLECDPPDVCPPTDTQTLSSGGESKDESNEKVNNTNIMDKVKDGIKSTGIPTDLASGSFGISPEGVQQALNNRINAPSNITGIPDNLQPGSFGISEAGAREALTNRIENQTGIPANLPEGAFTVTPKKKFNIPKINKKIPSYAPVNESEFIVDRDRALRLLSGIRDENEPNERKEAFAKKNNELIYQEVYGGTGRVFEYQGKLYKPGDPGYNDAFTGRL